jgi:hypothetical protein
MTGAAIGSMERKKPGPRQHKEAEEDNPQLNLRTKILLRCRPAYGFEPEQGPARRNFRQISIQPSALEAMVAWMSPPIAPRAGQVACTDHGPCDRCPFLASRVRVL